MFRSNAVKAPHRRQSRRSLPTSLVVVAAALALAACSQPLEAPPAQPGTAKGLLGQYYYVNLFTPPLGGVIESSVGGLKCGAASVSVAVSAAEPKQYLYATYGDAGACGVGGQTRFAWSERVRLTATPRDGNVFIGWAGDCAGVGACDLSAGADKTVVAIFGKPGSGHTNFTDPALHGPAYLNQSALVCTSCHGARLTGQGIAPSCAACHPWSSSAGTGGMTATSSITSVANPSVEGQLVAYTVTLIGSSTSVPGGSISLTLDGAPVPGCTALPVAGGAVACSILQPRGNHTIGFSSSGDAIYAPTSGSLAQTVTAAYLVGGNVTGLAGGGLTLSSPGQPDLVVLAGATAFTFANRQVEGSTYQVAVAHQPDSPAQACAVTTGSGSVAAGDVATISVACRSTWTQVAAGGKHSVGIRPDGTLWTWGEGQWGALGDGTWLDRRSPVQVPGSYALAAAGNAHTVALRTDGTVWAWGGNFYGQLGDGTMTNRAAPVQVLMPAGAPVVALAAGWGHSLAIRSDGTLLSWGWGNYGQLGIGSTTNQLLPVQVALPSGLPAGSGFASVSAGLGHTLATTTTGVLLAWGWNGNYTLGDGLRTTSYTPKQIATGYATVAAGHYHSAAVKTDGTLVAWGMNSSGQAGDGSPTPVPNGATVWVTTPTPSIVPAGSVFTAVVAGVSSTLALRSDETLWACGATSMLGDGIGQSRRTPAQVGSGPYARIAAIYYHAQALLPDGSLWAWGWNTNGQLGDGTTTERFLPVMVP